MRQEDYAGEILDLMDPKPALDKLPYCETARVTQGPPEIQIELRGLIYDRSRIKANEYLVEGHKRQITIPSTSMTGTDSRGDGHVAGGFPDATIIFQDPLKAGDEVAVIPSKDKQTIYVLFKIGGW